jgi:hypothetical protein
MGYADYTWIISRKPGRAVPDLQPGQKVTVNLIGLHIAEVEFGGSTTANGVIEAIDTESREITVRLNLSFSGQRFIIVSPARVSAL